MRVNSILRILFIGMVALMLVPVSGASMAQSRVETIAAVVDEEAVSESDVQDRMKLVIASSGMPDNQEMRERLQPQILNMLIEEKLKLQEAARMEIEIPQQEIENGFATIAQQNKFTPEQFRAVLRREGVSPQTLEDQIRSQIAWAQIVQLKLRPQITIADNEVDAVLERMQNNRGKTEYRVSEIFLPVEKPAEEPDVRQLADKLTRELLENRVPFQRLASQFSQAAGATKGGDLGWVQEGQLPAEVDEVLARMNEGEVSRPVRSLAGFHIVYLRGKRAMSAENMPSREEIMNNLGMERLDRLQRSYLMDLKAEAFIERRV